MSRESKRQFLAEQIAKITNEDQDKVNELIKQDSRIQHTCGMDSLDFVELIMECEREFNIAIHDDELMDNITVEKMLDLIEKKEKELYGQ